MSLPPHLAAAIAERGLPAPFLKARFATVDDHVCEGAKFHSPQPLIVREMVVGPAIEGRTAWLCSTCADNLVLLQWVIALHDGNPPWPMRREFGNALRKLVAKRQDLADAG